MQQLMRMQLRNMVQVVLTNAVNADACLRSKVVNGPNPCTSHLLSSVQGKTKVRQQGCTICVKEHVFWLHISVDKTLESVNSRLSPFAVQMIRVKLTAAVAALP